MMIPKGLVVVVAVLAVVGCGSREESPSRQEGEPMFADSVETPPILATNAFYYYEDVERAWSFYSETLGFETVADYGWAKILQLSPSSYLTLVDEARGMHSGSEPKSVTLAVVTEEVEDWWDYLSAQGVEMRSPMGETGTGRPHDGFVAVDPEGYFLEFERFNPHPENTALIPILAEIDALYPRPSGEVAPGVVTQRPPHLGVKATILWLYYSDLDTIQAFYRQALGGEIMVDQGWAKVFPVSSTGFLGFVDGARGLHSATEEKAVTVSFLTTELEPWVAHVRTVSGFTFRSEEISGEGDFVQTFVGYDSEGYFLEWDHFLDVPSNGTLLERIGMG